MKSWCEQGYMYKIINIEILLDVHDSNDLNISSDNNHLTVAKIYLKPKNICSKYAESGKLKTEIEAEKNQLLYSLPLYQLYEIILYACC